MGIFFNPGNEGFSFVLSSQLYVDKTGLIEYVNSVLGTEQRMLCVSRPRRFGKSMAAKMLAAYYSKGCNSEELFRHLNISQLPTYQKELNKHNVIYLDMQWFRSVAKEKGILGQEISYLQAEVIKELREQYPTIIDDTMTLLSEALFRIYSVTRERFILIIDEWDCIFREDKENVVQQERYLNFLRGMFKGILADSVIELAYMTGILPIKKYGTQSALNNFDEYTMLDPTPMEEYMGFTEAEVQNICKQYTMDFDKMKHWYDGYVFEDNMHIYSPKSVVDAVRKKRIGNYWTKTETYEALKYYIEQNFDDLKNSIISMLSGEKCKVNTRKFQNDMTNLKSKDDVMTLLIHLGYLAYNRNSKEVFIPNQEVAEEFENAIEDGEWEVVSNALKASDELLEQTIKKNEKVVAQGIDNIHTENTSILSYNNEQSLSCVIAIAYYSARKYYTLIRELPTGNGFADIVFFPKPHCDKPALIVELKWNRSANGAIEQMKNKKYIKALENHVGNVLLVGINYDKKTRKHECVIEEVELLKK